MLVGATAAALAAGLQPALAASSRGKKLTDNQGTFADSQLRRFMAAGAALGDGRILITGGYGRPWSHGSPPMALNSAIILDPTSGIWVVAAPMGVSRARHAAISLPGGRVAVLGGVCTQPTSSVEIYDSRNDSWSVGKPLALPRYDHSAIVDGTNIYLLGGSSQSMVTSVERYQLEVSTSIY